MNNKTVVLAIGGNAITKEGQRGYLEEQLSNIEESMEHVANLIEQGYRVVLTHGNGPQVGNILIQNDNAQKEVPKQPLDICVSKTQGQIGDMIVRCLRKKLRQRQLDRDVAAVITHVEVDPADSAFQHPSKPIGPFYSAQEAKELETNKHYVMQEDSGRGYRRVVPSPKPKNIVEQNIIRELSQNSVVVAAGGGGIPVYYSDNEMKGIEAVIDKDYASALLASQIHANYFFILTGVEQVAVNYGKENQEFLSRLPVPKAKEYMAQGQFPKGSMGPKIEAAIDYLENGGEQVIITSIDALSGALAGRTGTLITH